MPLLKKIVKQANILGNFFFKIVVFIVVLISVDLFLGTLTMLAAPKSVPIDLGNGFIYAEQPSPYHDSRMLTDENGNVLIQRDVRRVLISGKRVYGSKLVFDRSGGKLTYYICTFGEDCSDTQNYSKDELQKILKKRNLPPFTPGEITNPQLIKAGIKRFFGFGVPKDFRVNAKTIHD